MPVDTMEHIKDEALDTFYYDMIIKNDFPILECSNIIRLSAMLYEGDKCNAEIIFTLKKEI